MTWIIKASGEKAEFDPEKLKRSLRRVGTSPEFIQQVIDKLTPQIANGTSTHDIYKKAFSLLRKESNTLAAKYHLKRAIMQLGPSGFPFEKFVAELLKNQGYDVSTNNILQGVCVKHEIDVVAKKGNKRFIVECKYHNQQGLRSDVKVSLYVHARFQDISKKLKGDSINQGWLVTNTKFTDDAIQYGQCAGLHLVSWNHPHQNNLREMVEVSRLYPVTCLTSLSHGDKLRLLADNILLCKTIHQNPKLLQKYKLSSTRLRAILNECEKLCL